MTLEQVMELKMGNGNNVKVARAALTALADQCEKAPQEVATNLRALAARGQNKEGEGKKEKKAKEAKVEAPAVAPAPQTPEPQKPEVKADAKAKDVKPTAK